MKSRSLYVLSLVLVIAGAINWLLVALARLDLIAVLAGREFGQVSGLSGALYAIIGLAGLYLAVASWLSPGTQARKDDTRLLPR